MAEAPHAEEVPQDAEKPGITIGETEILGIILLVAIALAVLGRFGFIFNANSFKFDSIIEAVRTARWSGIFEKIIITYVTFANILSLFFLAVLTFSLLRVRELQRRWYLMINPPDEEPLAVEHKNERWERVRAHIASDNPSDWRLAILEADIILDEVLDAQGYVGDTIGDKLKKAVRGDFATIDAAWEAHRIRNAIAHEGQNFILTQREAQRILGLYEMVFREFNYI